MNSIIPFVFLFLAIFWLATGVNNLLNTDKTAMKLKQKKMKKVKKEVPLDKVKLKVRAGGALLVLLSLFILMTLKLDISFLSSPKLILRQGNVNTTKKYEKVIKDFIASDKIPGLVVGIVDGDENILYTYGYDGINKGEIVDEKTLFEIGSVSKVFTGLLLANAVDLKMTSLDDTVNTYIDSDKIGENSVFTNINMKHLATHTSGLLKLPLAVDFTTNTLYSALTGGNPYKLATKENMYRYMKGTKRLKSLGENWSYSNYAVGVLGMCLTNIHQKSYNEVLKEVITEPLGMKNTSVLYNDDSSTYADGYRSYFRLGSLSVGMRSEPWLIEEGMVAAGGIRSNGEDMLLFLDALVNEKLPFMATSKDPIFRIDEKRQMGMNWIIDYKDKLNKTVIWHNGQTGGFYSYIGFCKDENAGVFAITNSGVDVGELSVKLMELLID